MSLFDIILLIIIGGFGMFGLWFGFFHTLGSLLGTLAGAYAASRYYEPMAAWLVNVTGWGGNLPKVLMFVIAFVVINRLVGLAFWFVDRILSIVTKLPYVNSLNRFFGILLGLFEGAVTIGLIVYFVERFPLSEKFMHYLATSTIAPWTHKFAALLLPMLPDALKLLQSTVDYVGGKLL